MHTHSTATPAPLTYDDLLDLHFLLQADELFLQLMADIPMVGDAR